MKHLSSLLLICGVLVLTPSFAQNAKFGINLSGLEDWSREQAFLNHMKTARDWISQRQGVWDSKEALPLDKNGYVTALKPGQWATTLLLTEVSEHFPSGEYVLLYDGEGKFRWSGNSRSISSAPGREVVDFTPTGKGFIQLIMTEANPENYPRNMRFMRKEREKLLETQRFAPEFLERWRNVDTIRFMDWTRTNPSKLSSWSERPHPGQRTYSHSGAPWEEVIALCNELKVNAWINIPHRADEEFIRKTAEMFRDQLDPSLGVYIEFSNEVWNGMFPASRESNQRGLDAGLAPEGWRAGALQYAKDCVRMYEILDTVFTGPQRKRLRKVVATQAANIGYAKIVVEADGVAEGADVLAIAPYLTFNVPESPQSWNPDMPTASEVENWDLDQLFAYLNTTSLPQCTRWMDQQMELATKNGLELTCYESGQHLSALGNANRYKKLNDLLIQANRDPRMGQLYLDYLNHWTKIGGGLICLFNSGQRYTNAGSWGFFEHWGQTEETAVKYRAVRKWAEGLR
jgi:hypothetical protein